VPAGVAAVAAASVAASNSFRGNGGDSLAGVVFGQAFLHEDLVHHHRLQIHQKSQSKYKPNTQMAEIAQRVFISVKRNTFFTVFFLS
jgi:hypothetical protein